MSEIARRIERYAATRQDWPELRGWLASRNYPTPDRCRHDRDPYSDEEYPFTDGTWDTVQAARNAGLLTGPEYLEIVRVADRHA